MLLKEAGLINDIRHRIQHHILLIRKSSHQTHKVGIVSLVIANGHFNLPLALAD